MDQFQRFWYGIKAETVVISNTSILSNKQLKSEEKSRNKKNKGTTIAISFGSCFEQNKHSCKGSASNDCLVVCL